MENRMNRQILDYEVLRRLGMGGMGEVLQVRHVLTGRIEAMKVLLPNYIGNRQRQERFLREIQTVAKLEHPNIARLCTAATFEDQIVMVMDYVDGATVESMIEDKPLPIGKAVRYMAQALRALAYAHRQKIVHRDFKPANLMVTSDGTVKLMDFGIAMTDGARLTRNGSTVGTYYFMSPEQARGEEVDGRSDIYSAGVTLYEMVTGRPPFLGTSPVTLMDKHMNAAPPPPIDFREDLPPALNQVILKMLAKDPENRYATADEAREALEGTLPAAVVTSDERSSGRRTTETETPAYKPQAPKEQPGRVVTSDGADNGQDPGIRPVEPVPPPPPPRGRIWIQVGIAAAVIFAAAGGGYALVHRPDRGPGKAAPVVDKHLTDTPQPTPVPVSKPPVDQGGTTSAEKQKAERLKAEQLKAEQQKLLARNVPPVGFRQPGTVVGSAGTFRRLQQSGGLAQQQQQQNVQPPPPPVISAEEKAAQFDLTNLSDEAAPVDLSATRKQQEMVAQGLSLRSSVLGDQRSMNLNLGRARQALQAHDVSSAKQYMAQAKVNMTNLQTSLQLR